MSKSISVVFILLLIIIVGFAYFNYNQLNQIQSDLLTKEALLEKSEKLIKEQDASLVMMEEKIKEVLEKEEPTISAREDKLQKQLEGYQEELQTLQIKIEEVLQKNRTDSENISFLREEKSKLEVTLSEREKQWMEKEEESKQIISSLQKGIEQYEVEIVLVNNKVLNIEQHLESEQVKRKELEQDMLKYENTIESLRGKLALKQNDEAYVQQISQLELNKSKLEEEMSKKDSRLIQFQEEYQDLQNQLTEYEQKLSKLQEETAQALGQKEILAEIRNNLAQLEAEKSKMELILQEKETQWLEREKIDKDTIVLLQEEIEKYESNIKEIGREILVLREDLITEKSLKEPMTKEVDISNLERMLAVKEEEWSRQNEHNRQLVSYLKEQLEEYKKEIDAVKLDSSIFKEEIAREMEFQQQTLAMIKEKEEQISLLTSQIEQYIEKIDDYEKSLAEFRIKLQQHEEMNYLEQQNLMETIYSLVQKREEYQDNINQFQTQVNRFQLEIAQLKNKIDLLEQEAKYYEVKSGDSLWAIARNKYKEGIAWTKIFNANEGLIKDPDLIYPYQQFILPD